MRVVVVLIVVVVVVVVVMVIVVMVMVIVVMVIVVMVMVVVMVIVVMVVMVMEGEERRCPIRDVVTSLMLHLSLRNIVRRSIPIPQPESTCKSILNDKINIKKKNLHDEEGSEEEGEDTRRAVTRG